MKRRDGILKFKELARKNILDLKQKSRVRWAVDGDENSCFFHGLLNHNRRNNFIHGISKNGLWITNPLDIQTAARDFFKTKFSCLPFRCPSFICRNFKKLDQVQAAYLEVSFTLGELKKAVWDMGSDKAPGPYGFSFAFFKKYWEIIKGDLFLAAKYFES